MKIAFTSKGTTWNDLVDPRFGRTEFIVVFDENTNALSSYDNREVENEAHGAGTATSKKLMEIKPDVLITGNGPGQNALAVLQRLHIKMYAGAGEMTLQQAYEAYKGGKLTEV